MELSTNLIQQFVDLRAFKQFCFRLSTAGNILTDAYMIVTPFYGHAISNLLRIGALLKALSVNILNINLNYLSQIKINIINN